MVSFALLKWPNVICFFENIFRSLCVTQKPVHGWLLQPEGFALVSQK
jgi:hypothetical protein